MNVIRQISVIALLLMANISMFAQSTDDAVIKTYLGGIKQKPEQQVVVDSAIMNVSYRFVQQVTVDNGMELACDTMLLSIGKDHSVWLDPMFKSRIQAWFKANMAQVRKASAPSNSEEPLEVMLELRQSGTDYMEGNVGDPVQIYKDKATGRLTSYLMHTANGPKVMCEQVSDSLFGWTILPDTATLCGYLCQKATAIYGGRTYEAWFTPFIPVSDGPWKMSGLPGLILAAEDTEGCFSFQAIGLERCSDTFIAQDKAEFEPRTLKEFNMQAKKRKDEIPASFLYNGSVHYYNIIQRRYPIFER